MSCDQNNHSIRTIALIEAIHLCGSEANLALTLKIQQPAISKWINNPLIKIPYHAALKIEKTTGINIERLMPDQKEINDYLEKRSNHTLMLREIYKSAITTTNSVSLPFPQSDRFIIVGTDGVLISGLAILNTHSENKIQALILDLTSLIDKTHSIADLLHKLLISERIAIGLRLEQIIGNRQGQKTKINQEISCIKHQITGRTEAYVATIIGFNKDTYVRAKQVYLSMDQKLINATNNKTMAIAKAAKLIKLAKQEQSKFNLNN